MKYRAYDLALCLLFIIPMGICVCILALIVILIDRHSPFYVSQRIGQNEQVFKLYKLRTMTSKAPELPTNSKMSSYVTPLGSILRKTSLDEFPQIINILRGNMSWVGPRPCLGNEFNLIIGRRKHDIFSLKPGLTGLAQINGRDSLTLQEKLYWERRYMTKMSLAFNTYILSKTLINVALSKHVSY